jgi:hypothetical protein
MHVASELLWSRSLEAEAASLPIFTSTVVQVPHVTLGLCVFVPRAVLMACLGFRLPVWMTQLVMG